MTTPRIVLNVGPNASAIDMSTGYEVCQPFLSRKSTGNAALWDGIEMEILREAAAVDDSLDALSLLMDWSKKRTTEQARWLGSP